MGSRNALHTAAFDSRVKAVVTLGTTLDIFRCVLLPALTAPSFIIKYLNQSAQQDIDLLRETHILPLSPRTPIVAIHVLHYFLQDSTYSSLKFVPSINVPTLCIYGENDVTVIPKASKRVFENISSQEKELLVIPNVNNAFMTPEGKSKAGEVLDTAIAWMNKYLLGEK
jgi:pimeloyl-ACP methyl ester carboxylesterase